MKKAARSVTIKLPSSADGNERKKPCICGKCQCRKHHCPVHHSDTYRLLRRSADDAMLTHYQRAFQRAMGGPASRRGLIIPQRIVPAAPKGRMDLRTVHHRVYQPLPLPAEPRNIRPEDKLMLKSIEPGNTSSSYNIHFPARQIEATFPAETLMRTTIPRSHEISASAAYATTNQSMFAEWSGGVSRRSPFGEPPQRPFFSGEFHGYSVVKDDYTAEVTKGRPSTSFKNATERTVLKSDDALDGTTTNLTAYNPPIITEQAPKHLKKRSKTTTETRHKAAGKIEASTQYSLNNPGYATFPPRRPICTPQPDTLRLFTGEHALQSEKQSNYTARMREGGGPMVIGRPSTSFKPVDSVFKETADERVDSDTAYKSDFPVTGNVTKQAPKHLKKRSKTTTETRHKAVGKIEASTQYSLNNPGYQTFPPRRPICTPQPDTLRLFLGEHALQSEKQSNYTARMREGGGPMVIGRPSTSFKPVDSVFKDSAEMKVDSDTAYKSDFPVREMPKSVCPAEVILAMS